ncbi:MAG: uncharacterized membrane protein YkvA (DUF1232 family) [Candidatus Azotimanducaceae bacterium]|jgi:uncharacterized membrane protein YkvA (DUF1232 family)|tara:strand:+ start:86 stop:541 length:456 start_codon:yes stop_codon:yes gene_type:complete
MSLKVPSGFSAYLRRGAKLLSNPSGLKRLVVQAAKKLNGSGSEKIKAVGEQLGLLIDLLKAYIAGEYRDISPQAIASVAGAIIYFVVPLDGVPDFLFGWGFIDDAAVVSYVIAQLSTELESFKQWRNTAAKTSTPALEQPDDELLPPPQKP